MKLEYTKGVNMFEKEALQEDKLVECNKMDKWEIKENE